MTISIDYFDTIVCQGSKQRKFVRELFLRFNGYLEGMFGNPSLTQIRGKKTCNKHRTRKINLRNNNITYHRILCFSLVFLCLGPCWTFNCFGVISKYEGDQAMLPCSYQVLSFIYTCIYRAHRETPTAKQENKKIQY